MSSTQAPVDLSEIIGRALVDKDFRERLFRDPEAALVGIDLCEEDRITLDRLDRASLEAHAAKIGTGKIVSMIVPAPPPEQEPEPEPEPEPEYEPEPEPEPEPEYEPKPEPEPEDL